MPGQRARNGSCTTEVEQGATMKQNVYLVRHGETEWSLSGQHTGVTDIPLTANGRALAARLRPVLANQSFALVLVSPLQRARETCQLAGLGDQAVIDADLREWNYGEYEGLTPQQIRAHRPGWNIFRDGCPGGETPAQIGARADRGIARLPATPGNVVARWIGLPASGGQHFLLNTATLNVLGDYEGEPAVEMWNAPLAKGD
jgi:hypothetical protein